MLLVTERSLQKIVVKVGSAVLTDSRGRISSARVSSLAGQIAEARARGVDVALVSSGAIAAGMGRMKIARKPEDVTELQAAAAVGQGILMHTYSEMFAPFSVPVAQVLLTQADMNHRQRYLNARRTLTKLFEMGVVPIINENDTVAIEEITFGDNDMLGALVAGLLKADLLFLLTDTAGLFTADPRKSEEAGLIERVDVIDEKIRRLAGEAGTSTATGGMSSKIEAISAAASAGVDSIIVDGRKGKAILDVLDGGKVGTYFPAGATRASRKHWIGYAKQSEGSLVLDRGAVEAVTHRGKSVLAAGVLKVEGDFRTGACLDLLDEKGTIVGKGLSSYDSADALSVKGMRSQKVREVLGEKPEPLVHRDSMVVFSSAGGRATGKKRETEA